ncbi:MAG: site-specific integrase [Alistipes sp.]|uniref:site-specific integrase n=1 Tax=Alistipes sp. TaxID=1872444 RepID=UPI0025C3F76C|nr:site-specific integrase [Alistipes sp.]MCD8275275.1 site-specific integrase [Alistipes sp.]
MNRKTFCISFFLRRVRTVKGMAPILARITVNGISKEVYTQCRTPVDKWDTAKGRATGRDKLAYEVNAYIDDFRAKVVEIYRTLQAEGFEGNALEIKERLQSPGKQAKMFLEELTLYCEKRQKEVGVRITQLTSNKYYRLCRYLREYTKQECKKDDIRLSAVSYGYLNGFNTYLQTAHRCHHNGAVNILDCLRNFMLYCLRNEWVEKNPFKNYKLKEVAPPPKEHLSKKEIELLMEKPMPNLRLENVRDIFVFCCLTGLAFADVKELKREHLTTDEQGNMWIRKPREKTAVMSTIPLLKQPKAILQKYAFDLHCIESGKLLPVPSNQKMNAYMSEIATICGLNKKLTTHCARHTFACLAVEYGMPIDVLAKILGHTNTNMTRHYAKFSEQLIGREMQKIGEVFAAAN